MRANKKKKSIALLLLIALSLIIGYAYLTSSLQINGNSRIHNASWNVYWDNVQVADGSVDAAEPEIDTSKTTVSFEVDLDKPGDFFEFTVDAVNDGSIDAMINSIGSTVNNASIDNLPNYLIYSITYSDDKVIMNNHLLRSGETETYKVRVEYKKDLTSTDLPSSDTEFHFEITINDVQADETAFERKKYIDVDDLKTTAVPSGEGLSLSTVEENTYYYRGANPNNYIMLGEDMYRMLSIGPDNTVKVIKLETIGLQPWDVGSIKPDGITSTRSSANSSDYCHGTANYGCNSWGSATSTLDGNGNHITQVLESGSNAIYVNLPLDDAYLNVYLNGGTYTGVTISGWYNSLPQETKNVIVSHLFNIGSSKFGDLTTSLESESSLKWEGKVAIITASEYVQTNSNIEECGTTNNLSRVHGDENCKTISWVKHNSAHTLSKNYSGTQRKSDHFLIDSNYYLDTSYMVNGPAKVFPSFYLTSSLKLTGEGTETKPYRLYTGN